MMSKNVITVRTALSTGVLLGGFIFSTPTMGTELDYYTSTSEHVSHKAKTDDVIVQPTISFDCNAETEISMIQYEESDVLTKFAESILKDMKPLDADISQWVDDNFWDLV